MNPPYTRMYTRLYMPPIAGSFFERRHAAASGAPGVYVRDHKDLSSLHSSDDAYPASANLC